MYGFSNQVINNNESFSEVFQVLKSKFRRQRWV